MTVCKDPHHRHKDGIRLTLDARKRISLAKFLPNPDVSSVRVYVEKDKIILELMAEIPAHELCLYKNPEALKAVKEGLKQSREGKIRRRGSFSKYAKDEI